MKRHALLKGLFSLLLLASLYTPAQANQQRPFDYYLMSLSWSPQFCSTHQQDPQCSRHYGVVLHGLWPQYTKGYPQSCTKEPIPAALIHSDFADLYPSEKLALHEWDKHGTCSGLAPRDYLLLSQKLKQSVATPKTLQDLAKPLRVTKAQLNELIRTANPSLSDAAIAFSCAGSGRFLQEIYVCFNKQGTAATACGTDVQNRSRKSCGKANFLIRSVR
jgi:ribonuclease T2